MLIFGIDPAPERSGWVIVEADRLFVQGDLCATSTSIVAYGIDDNAFIRHRMQNEPYIIGIEGIGNYGAKFRPGKSVFDTCIQIGRFAQKADELCLDCIIIPRQTIKTHVCGTVRANDSAVRAAIIKRFDGFNICGKGALKTSLKGITSHCWSALAVALTVVHLENKHHQ